MNNLTLERFQKIIDNLKENSQEMTDEFYVKDDSNFTFYFYNKTYNIFYN